MILSDFDYKFYWVFSVLNQINQSFNSKLCNVNAQLFRLFEKNPDEFFMIENLDGQTLIVYNKEGELILSKCVEIPFIELQSIVLFKAFTNDEYTS